MTMYAKCTKQGSTTLKNFFSLNRPHKDTPKIPTARVVLFITLLKQINVLFLSLQQEFVVGNHLLM